MTSSSTPLDCLAVASQTPSGLLELDTADGEVELMRRNRGWDLRSELPLPNKPSGTSWGETSGEVQVVATTHRLVFGNSNANSLRFLHLSNVQHMQATGGPSMQHWNASYKILLVTYSLGELVLACKTGKQDRDALLQVLEQACARKAWEQAARQQEQKQQQQKQSIPKRKVGVDAIVASQKLRHQKAAQLAEEALSGDAEVLLQQASELIHVIQKYVSILQKNSNALSGNESLRFESLLQDMGMTSALSAQEVLGTRKSALHKKSSKHHQQDYLELLGRQVCDFLWNKWKHQDNDANLVLPLTDVYCMFNRARGTNLISPQDLTQALEWTTEHLELGVVLRRLPSSQILVVQPSAWNAATVTDRLVDVCSTGCTPLQASRALQTSPLLAMEHLQAAEQSGHLCRDETMETIRFYPNLYFKV